MSNPDDRSEHEATAVFLLFALLFAVGGVVISLRPGLGGSPVFYGCMIVFWLSAAALWEWGLKRFPRFRRWAAGRES